MNSKTILATCYAVNPYNGSEDGTGWNLIYQIARYNKVIAITRENNREAIERFMAQYPAETYQNMTFLYFDLPYWMRFWKKGSRGSLLYYTMWQKGIVYFIKRQKVQFDIVHNVNFHNDWTPSYLWKFKKPMVWGPIGHHPLIPSQYLQPYAKKYLIKDRATWLVKKLFWKLSFGLQNTVNKSNYIFCINKGVQKQLNLKNKSLQIMPAVATEDFFNGVIAIKDTFQLISVGRFVPLKGFDLTILSFIRFLENKTQTEKEKCKLILVGTGPEKSLYKKIITENNVEKFIEIIEWIDRKELMKLYEKASVFLFPSHEGAGMVIPEALSFGLPIICLDNEGPGEFINKECGFAIPHNDYDTTILELSDAIQKLYSDANFLKKMSQNARNHFEMNFTWNKKGEILNQVYNQL